jgi:biopolymer transport protein ExbB
MKSLYKRMLAAILLAGASLAASAPALAWWNTEWSYRTRIELDTSASGVPLSQTIERTPVLVRLHSGNIAFADLKADGSDLRFVAGDDRTALRFHFEKFDPREEVALVWVDVSQLPPDVTTYLYAYYGNANAAPAATPATTYPEDYALVWHFTGSELPADATANANNALAGPNQREVNGLIGPALALDGTAALALPASASLRRAAGQPLTVSAWIRANTPSASGSALIWTVPGVQLGLENGVPFIDVGGERVRASAPVIDGTWTHIALRADGASTALLVDGSAAGELAHGLPAIEAGGFLGGSAEGSGFVGQIDELRIVRSALARDALLLAARSEGVGAKLLKFDTAEKTEEGGRDYFSILLHALTPDAWAVIVLLGCMSLISWAVMIAKGLAVSRTINANDTFRDLYRKTVDRRAAHGGLSGPQLGKSAALSSLARLFAVGQKELNERLAEEQEGERATSRYAIAPQSVAAIRSALDAAFAREGQKLNRGMVLLTIAISGGPFLGLLGTVIGVMITFASVAAAGDVNINAIAPGIAAALLATVAGLAVAIPALFGYNYLQSRMEEIATDHQIFVDELEKRIAETYRAPVGA